GHYLFRGQTAGANLFVWTLAISIGAVCLRRGTGSQMTTQIVLLSGAVLFSTSFMWRASGVLHLLAGVCMALCLTLAAVPDCKKFLFAARAGALLKLHAETAGHCVVGFVHLLARDIDWKNSSRNGLGGLRAVLSGCFIVLPFFVVFSLLFASADPIFKQKFLRLMDFETAIWIVLMCWVAAGYFRKTVFTPVEIAPPVLRSKT